jgi:hypothetical protein
VCHPADAVLGRAVVCHPAGVAVQPVHPARGAVGGAAMLCPPTWESPR